MSRRLAIPLALVLGLASLGWNPLLYAPGPPLRWSTAAPVVWNPDGGALGALANADANLRCAEAFLHWQNVDTTTISYSQGLQIRNGSNVPVDVTSANYSTILLLDNGQNPIIYDNDRDIFAAIGKSASVLGFAGVLRTSGTQITKGYAVLQGDWIDGDPSDTREITVDVYVGVMVHEFGHFSGLGHSSVNRGPAQHGGLGACPPPTIAQLETMSPFAHNEMATLHHDEIIGISALYPTVAFGSTSAGIAGRVLDRDGASAFDGANVILRRDTIDCNLLYDDAQATQSGVNPAETGGAGSYRFAGLTPGASYTVAIASIDTGGSYPIGDSFGTPPLLRGPDEFYNGVDENSFDPPDTPAAVVPLVAGAGGTTLPGIEVKINNPGFPGAIPPAGAAALRVSKFDGNTALPPRALGLDDGTWESAYGVSGTSRLAWISRFTPAPQDYPFRLERIDLQFVDPTADAGRAIQLLVYVDPSGSGDPAVATLVRTQDATIQFLHGMTLNQYALASPVTVTAGDVYVGAIDLVADAGTNLIAALDATPSGRAYHQLDGTAPGGFVLCDGAAGCHDCTWMIRAYGSTMPAVGTFELTWGDACNALDVPSQDAAVYQGSLAALSTIQDHAPIACGTGGEQRWILPASGVPGNVYWLVAPLLADREGSLGTGTGGIPRTPAATCEIVETDPCP